MSDVDTTRWRRRLIAALTLPLLAACTASPEPASGLVTLDLDDRPFQLHVPEAYDAGTRAPLVVLLHGYTSHAEEAADYFGLTAEADRRGFLVAMPEGTENREGHQFWNATPACCDFHGSGVDDSGYLSRLIDRVASAYAVDPARVYFVGHSNGGFMALRMACDHAGKVTAVVSLAGAATDHAAGCAPSRPVSVLQIHGTADRTILFDGHAGRYPSAPDTVALWRRLDGCADQPDTSAAPLDLDSGLAGAETTVLGYQAGCGAGSRVELWTIEEGGHIPAPTGAFPTAVADFLLARVAPAR
ncbi:alpha/beta hydrolase family esterase [Phytohabitans kaempferiae]|uniref:Alpha/beta hydrolase family esterase n=1 Tax=Phytohabitans kaempferiae TaxID=1620943 RepID=A0ABV6MHW2_9ACTN